MTPAGPAWVPSGVLGRRGGWAVCAAFAVAAIAAASPAGAQERGDSIRADSLRADSLAVDTLQLRPDSLQEASDSVQQIPDSLVFHELPRMPGGVPEGWDRGVWEWSREDLLSSRAVVLSELLADVPGVISVRAGDYGAPSSISAFGLTGGGVRLFIDGFEMLPLDGAVPDLSRVALGGLSSVRLVRGAAGLRVELESYRIEDPRPISVLEVGTGALRTNLLRGTFVHPRALGGSLGIGLERIDTRGPRGAEPGSEGGGWFRYTLHRGDDAGLRFELRTASAENELEGYPPNASRRDWVLRGRLRLAEGLVAEGFTGNSSVDGGGDDLTPLDASRRQHGIRLGWERGAMWADAAYRLLAGPDLPASSLEVEGGLGLPGYGGVSGRLTRDTWEGRGTRIASVTAWTEPRFGLSAFASWEDGTSGSRIFQPRVPVEKEPAEGEQPSGGEEPEEPEEPVPTHRFMDRTALRLGAMARVGPARVSAARLTFEADSLIPLGILADRNGAVVSGGSFSGLEVTAELGLPLGGWELYGSMTRWDRTSLYLPRLSYDAGLRYHGLPKESGNLEIWTSIGVRGRDPMLSAVPVDTAQVPPLPTEVPFYQSWDAFLQLRIVTVSLFIRFENLTVRRNNQDLPDRVLPEARATYGVRWTLWN